MREKVSLTDILIEKKSIQNVSVPTYNRKDVTVGIVHIGLGGFHRSHQAYYVDSLLASCTPKNWGICAVSLLQSDFHIYDVLTNQEGLYTLITPDQDSKYTARIIGSIVERIYAPENPDSLIQKLANEDLKIITLTITEGGYNISSDGGFNWSNQDVVWDLSHLDNPKTVFGYLCTGLKLRKSKGLKGVTIQSCDNIEHNGDVIRRMLYSFVEKVDLDLVKWMDENVTFPNSMVDRITPVTSDELKNEVTNLFQLEDGWPIIAESFCQWIIEDNYANGRPDWERVGVHLVKDVTPYEKMKIRLLNGGHTLVGLAGYLCGHKYIHESVEDADILKLWRKYMDVEVTPTLDIVDKIDTDEYKNSLIERFRNPFLNDTVERIISNSSAKFPSFILPVIKERSDANLNIRIGSLIVAFWYVYLQLNLDKVDVINDVLTTQLVDYTNRAEQENNPLLFLELPHVFDEISGSKEFHENFLCHINALKKYDAKLYIQSLLQEQQ